MYVFKYLTFLIFAPSDLALSFTLLYSYHKLCNCMPQIFMYINIKQLRISPTQEKYNSCVLHDETCTVYHPEGYASSGGNSFYDTTAFINKQYTNKQYI